MPTSPPPAPPITAASPRSTLLAVGIVLQALNAVLAAFIYLLGGLLAAGVLGVSLAELSLFQLWPFSMIAALGALLFFVAVGFQALMLYTCWRAWEGDRTWLWVLIGLSVLGLVNTGPISVVVGVVTIIGAWQAIEVLDGKR
jgi:hypothetical protein